MSTFARCKIAPFGRIIKAHDLPHSRRIVVAELCARLEGVQYIVALPETDQRCDHSLTLFKLGERRSDETSRKAGDDGPEKDGF